MIAFQLFALAMSVQGNTPASPPRPDVRGSLELEIQADVRRSQLPMRQGSVTTYRMEGQGTALITYQRTTDDYVSELGAEQDWRNGIRTTACANTMVRSFLARGGVFVWVLHDASGDEFQTFVAQCP